MHKYLIGACLACAVATPAIANEDDATEVADAIDWSLTASGVSAASSSWASAGMAVAQARYAPIRYLSMAGPLT